MWILFIYLELAHISSKPNLFTEFFNQLIYIMRNKTGIILLTIIVTALCVFYLSFTFKSRAIQADADQYALQEDGTVGYFKKQEYLDSLWNKPVYNLGFTSFTYKEVSENELNLGLDLQGGMHVTLEVSPIEILIALSGNSTDESFLKALEEAKTSLKDSQDNFTTLFFDAFNRFSNGKTLASIFANSSNRGLINFNSSDDDVKKVIESEVDGAMDLAFNIIRTRVDKFGVSQPNVQRVQGTGRIQVELPGVDNAERVRKLLSGVAKLEFLEVWDPQEYVPYLQQVNDLIVKRQKAEALLAEGTTNTTVEDVAISEESSSDNLFEGDSAATDSTVTDIAETPQISPIFSLLRSQSGLVYNLLDTGKINAIIQDPEVRTLMPSNMRFLWSYKAFELQGGETEELIQLYVVKKARNGKAPLTGEVVVDARQSFDQGGRPDISMSMNVEGSKKWKKLTGSNIGKPVAIILDDYVYSAPTVQSEISGGSSQITGDFTIDEAKDLANVLKAGKLPAPTRIVEEVVVGPSLGVEAQNQGLTSIVVGLVLVILFMVAYYSKGGLVANAALLINIFFIFGVLAQLSAALTLPGIAGIVLTIGMSIDANVLIFERIREEMQKEGNNLLNAINIGYEKAFWTIFDSNLTTMLTGIFLYLFGTGPVKGFAVTLMIGIACSFFSAVFITRVIVSWMTKNGNESKISFVTPLSAKLLEGFNFEFLSKRKIAYIASSIVIVIGGSLIFIQGLNLGVDFKGGRSYIVSFTEPVVPSQLEVELSDDLENSGIEVKTFGGNKTLKITTSYLVDDESNDADSKVMQAIITGISDFTGKAYQEKDALLDDTSFTIPSTSKVGATIADDIKNASSTAGLFSLAAIFLYIWVRFRRWRFGLGAVVALIHDTLMVFSIFGIARALGFAFEIDQVFVAAMLTVIGYSINDTVVVFDRVREFLLQGAKEDLIDTLNRSVNSTLNRTLITSLTTLLVVLILFIFGGEVLRGFSFALLVGIIFGTYSSVFIATPVVYDIAMLQKENKSEENNGSSDSKNSNTAKAKA